MSYYIGYIGIILRVSRIFIENFISYVAIFEKISFMYSHFSASSHVRPRTNSKSLFGDNDNIVREDSGSEQLTTSSMCMEVKAISEMLDWVRL